MKNDKTNEIRIVTHYSREDLVAMGKNTKKTESLIEGESFSIYIASRKNSDFHLHEKEEIIIVVDGKISLVTLKETTTGKTGDIFFIPSSLLHKTESNTGAIILSIRNNE